mgnify:CR=1 FL=1
MKKRIEQLLNGKFIYEQPGLLFSQDEISVSLKAGDTTKNEIYLEQMIIAGSAVLSHLQTDDWYRDLTVFQEQQCACHME